MDGQYRGPGPVIAPLYIAARWLLVSMISCVRSLV